MTNNINIIIIVIITVLMTSSHTTIIFIKNSDLTNFYTVDGIIIIIGVG